MTTKVNQLTQVVQSFFSSYLPVERALRTHTIMAYRDTIKLYLKYLTRKQKIPIQQLGLDQLTAKSVLAFVEDCTSGRKNTTKTTNQRLAVLKSFFAYLMNIDPTRMNQYERISHLKSRRVPYRPVEYLERNEVEAVLGGIDRSSSRGKQHHAALLFLYNTGARAQELCDVRIADLRLEKPFLVGLHGKGNKLRQVPLWKETVEAIGSIVTPGGASFDDRPVFTNQKGEKLTRFGLRYILNAYVEKAAEKIPAIKLKKVGPHTIRHTTAMHLLQSGVDITVIKAWLGHVDLNTTHGYVEIDLKMKEQALQKTKIRQRRIIAPTIAKNEKDLLLWLESFGDM
jgi:integrase/recombinase XerD